MLYNRSYYKGVDSSEDLDIVSDTISNKKNYLLTLVSGMGGVVFSMMLNLITIPISLDYWGADRYGIWVLLTSTLTYLGMTNLGLNTAAGVLMGKNPEISDKIKILRRSFHILVFSTVLIFLAFFVLNAVNKDWINFVGEIPANLKEETYCASVVLVVFYLLSLPFSLLSAVYSGFHKLYIDNIFNTALIIVNFLVLVGVIVLKGNLIDYAVLWGVALVFFNVIKYFYFYWFIYRKLPKEIYEMQRMANNETEYKTIFSVGLRFFFIGIASTIVWSSDILVISNFVSIQSVVPYFITFKLFSILFAIIFQVNNSIMPLMGKEYGQENTEWLCKIYGSFAVLMIVLGGAMWIGSILFFRDFITIWTSPTSYAGLYVVIALGGYSYLLGMSVLNSGVINSLNYSRLTPIVAWGEAIFKILISIWLGKMFGLAGVAMGTFLGSLFSQTLLLPILIRKGSAGKLVYDLTFMIKHLVIVLLPCLFLSICLQLFAENVIVRMGAGTLLILFYLYLSYVLIPLNYLKFFLQHFNDILVRTGFKSIRLSI